MKFNKRKGFRRICIVLNGFTFLAICLFGGNALYERQYLKQFYYWNDEAPSYSDAGYSEYKRLREFVADSVVRGYITEAKGRKFLDITVTGTLFQDLAQGDLKMLKEGILRLQDWAKAPLSRQKFISVFIATLKGEEQNGELAKHLFKGKVVVPLNQRMDWSAIYQFAILSGLALAGPWIIYAIWIWIIYSIWIYIAEGFKPPSG